MSIIIIGTGLAGYLFAKEFRKHDTSSTLTLITKGDGYFYSKPLLSTALSNHKTPDQLSINSVEAMRTQLNAEILIHSEVFQIDADNKKIFFRDAQNQTQTLYYDKLILANGADTVQIPLEGNAVNDVLHVNQFEEYRIFRAKLAGKKRVAILGVGLVGCEFANDLISAGYDVTMIAPDNYPLKKWVPEEIGRALENTLNQAGVQFHLSVFPKIVNRSTQRQRIQIDQKPSVSECETIYEIILSDGTKLQADLILSAAGIRPNLSLAQTANLKTNIGIMVNSHLQTSNNDIYALGDCAEVNNEMKMYVAPIMQNARILAEFLTGKSPVIQNQIMPVAIKTLLCPIVVVPPEKNTPGEWKTTVDGVNVQALFYNTENHLCGFALSGECMKNKAQLMKQMMG